MEQGMSKAYATTGKIFEQVSLRAAPAMYEQLRAIKQGEIVVVKGDYDHIEKLLDAIKVPYSIIGPEDIKQQNGGRVMFVNCRQYDGGVPAKMLQEFVGDGARIVTTDWSLSLVQKAFPGQLEKVGKTGDEVVEIQPHTDMARKFLGLNYTQCHPQWWLEGSSDLYVPKKDSGVVPLITSDEMKETHKTEYVAVGFPVGRGEVIHFISHLELQRTKLKTKADAGSLDDFLKKMQVEKTTELDEAKVAELEAAYSTLNMLAYLCIPMPIVNFGGNSITYAGMAAGAAGSKKGGVPKSLKLV